MYQNQAGGSTVPGLWAWLRERRCLVHVALAPRPVDHEGEFVEIE